MDLNEVAVTEYFMKFSIRVECYFLTTASDKPGVTRTAKIYCPTKYTKEQLAGTAHIIKKSYLLLKNPNPIPGQPDQHRPYILVCSGNISKLDKSKLRIIPRRHQHLFLFTDAQIGHQPEDQRVPDPWFLLHPE